MEKIIELQPIPDNKDYVQIEKRIKAWLREHLFHPMLKTLRIPQRKLRNAISDLDSVLDAIEHGHLGFRDGKFFGAFDADISKELKYLGAKFDRDNRVFEVKKLSENTLKKIETAQRFYLNKVRKVDAQLASLDVNSLIHNLTLSDLFKKTLAKTEKNFAKQISAISVPYEYSPERQQSIADNWSNNLKLDIKRFTDEQVIDLRKVVKASAETGERYEALIPPIKKVLQGIDAHWENVDNKAKFLARQETNLLQAQYKQDKYISAGITEYKWKCRNGTGHANTPTEPWHRGQVRYGHWILNNKIFSFNDPPVTSNPGQKLRRNNPQQDYNCIPSYQNVSFNGFVNKAFRRRYSGKLTRIVTTDDVFHDSTPNHPVFTSRGWVNAHEVKIGDYVFNSKVESLFTKEMKYQNLKASVEQVFYTLSLCSKVTSEVTSKSDFHNDVGEYKKVDVISVNRDLILKGIIEAYEELREFLLQRPNAAVSEFSPVNRLLKCTTLFFSNLICVLRELSSILVRHATDAESIRFFNFSNFDSTNLKPSINNSATDHILIRNGKHTHFIFVILDSLLSEWDMVVGDDGTPHADSLVTNNLKPILVKDVQEIGFTGQVYNFETSTNWYESSNIIFHNCNCIAIPIYRVKTDK